MLQKRCLLLFLLLLCSSQATAEITLKKSFFTGWKYSVDGSDYKGVGFSGTDLRNEMEGNEGAQSHMLRYKSAKTWATITGVPGGALIGWPIGGYIGGGEWKDGYTAMIIAGSSLAVVSIVLEASATRNLKKAVALYNEGNQSLGLMIGIVPPAGDREASPLVGLAYRF